MTDFDVLIVGGGPAGAVASLKLSSLGYKVLLVERKKEIEQPIICGEYLAELKEIEKAFPAQGKQLLRQTYSLLSQDNIKNRLNNLTIEVEGLTKTIPFSGFVIDRRKLIAGLIKRSQSYGARVLTETSFTQGFLEGEKIICQLRNKNGQEIVACQFLVGADGYPSRVAISFGFRNQLSEEDVAYTLTQQVSNLSWQKDSLYMCFGQEIAPGGYAWVIPQQDGIYNIGLGVVGLFKKKLLSYYKRFRQSPYLSGAKEENRLWGKLLPVGGLFKELSKGRVVLLGDASGAVMPTNGGGIFTAMMGGLALGEVVKQYGLNEKAASEYQRLIKEALAPTLQFGFKLRKAAQKVEKYPWLYRLLYASLPEKVTKEVIVEQKSLITRIIALGRFVPFGK